MEVFIKLSNVFAGYLSSYKVYPLFKDALIKGELSLTICGLTFNFEKLKNLRDLIFLAIHFDNSGSLFGGQNIISLNV
jgi:hypothetical protein